MPMQCAHAYRNSQKQCPHEAEDDSTLCRWHAKRDDKSFDGEDLSGYDLEEAYLAGASLKDCKVKFWYSPLFRQQKYGVQNHPFTSLYYFYFYPYFQE